MSWKGWKGKQVEGVFREQCSNALVSAMNATKSVVLQQIPHDEGALQDTVIVEKDPNDDLNVAMGAGGGGTGGMPILPYALKWHEQEASFQKGRKSQYVRDPVKQVLPGQIKSKLKQVGLK